MPLPYEIYIQTYEKMCCIEYSKIGNRIMHTYSFSRHTLYHIHQFMDYFRIASTDSLDCSDMFQNEFLSKFKF